MTAAHDPTTIREDLVTLAEIVGKPLKVTADTETEGDGLAG
jgi:hypothetical protein